MRCNVLHVCPYVSYKLWYVRTEQRVGYKTGLASPSTPPVESPAQRRQQRKAAAASEHHRPSLPSTSLRPQRLARPPGRRSSGLRSSPRPRIRTPIYRPPHCSTRHSANAQMSSGGHMPVSIWPLRGRVSAVLRADLGYGRPARRKHDHLPQDGDIHWAALEMCVY